MHCVLVIQGLLDWNQVIIQNAERMCFRNNKNRPKKRELPEGFLESYFGHFVTTLLVRKPSCSLESKFFLSSLYQQFWDNNFTNDLFPFLLNLLGVHLP